MKVFKLYWSRSVLFLVLSIAVQVILTIPFLTFSGINTMVLKYRHHDYAFPDGKYSNRRCVISIVPE